VLSEFQASRVAARLMSSVGSYSIVLPNITECPRTHHLACRRVAESVSRFFTIGERGMQLENSRRGRFTCRMGRGELLLPLQAGVRGAIVPASCSNNCLYDHPEGEPNDWRIDDEMAIWSTDIMSTWWPLPCFLVTSRSLVGLSTVPVTLSH
jgi:hypothetical protein